MIAPNTLDSIRQSTDLAQLGREYGLMLQRVAGGYICLCPFHRERTPSFRFNTSGPRQGSIACFGCGWQGNAVMFVSKIEGIPFPAAAELLADRAGIPIAAAGYRSPIARAADLQDRAMSPWWWKRRWESVRAALDVEYERLMADNGDLPFASACGRLLRYIESLSAEDKVQEFRCHVTSAERAEWREWKAEEDAFAKAFMGMVDGERAA